MDISKEPLASKQIDEVTLGLEDTVARVEELLETVRENRTINERKEALDELIALHERLEAEDEKCARKAEVAFLLLLRDNQDILEDPDYRGFVAEGIDQESFYQIKWESAEEVIRVAEALYGFRYKEELPPDQVTAYVRDLVRHALRQFERENRPEMMFDLFQRAPIPTHMMDAELVRLRNWLHLYEMRRVSRKKNFLYGFLIVQALLVFLIFPWLFQNVENGQIQRQVEQATGLEVVEGEIVCTDTEEGVDCAIPRQFLDFQDSLYWSVITYGSIGYGDIAPLTNIGRLLAGIHGLMGVLTTGIIAGLVLNWISPRSLLP